MKTVVLLVYGDDDHGAMDFEDMFDAQEVYEDMLAKEVTKESLITEDGLYINCEIYEFGGVDQRFVMFIIDKFLDYDQLKSKNMYFVEAK